ncbi:MAG: protein kinase domain-containing protein [Elainella sp.]
MVTAGSELTPGTSIDRRYLIQCTLGRGGFGRTYLAADERRFNELCVLKEFVPGNQTDPVVAQKLRELFQREAAILHKLDHPQIPKFFAGFEENGRLFIAQEYIDGKTYWRMLQERQRRGEVFSQPEVIRWLWDLLRVLDYLHQQGIVHRDISPDNIMLPRGSQMPILIDFGVVKQVLPHLYMTDPSDPDGLIQASVSVGKFGYAPYEQIRMGQCSPRSDLYALAVTAVVLLTGKPPNLLMDAKTLEWKWQRQVRLDPGFSTLLATMMADRPQDRFGSARAVLQALQPLYLPVRILPSPRVVKPRRRVTETQPVFTEIGLVNGRATQADLFSSEATGFMAGAELDWAERAGQAQIAESQAGQPHLGQPQLQPLAESEATVETYLDLSPIGHAVAMPDSPTQIEPLDTTQIEPTVPGAIVVVPQPELLWPAAARTLEPRLSLRSLLSLVRAVVLRSPQDQLGSVKQLRFSFKQIAVWGILAVLPLGGAVVGIRSPHINSLCSALSNCVGQNLQERYQQAIEQADSAGLLSTSARSVNDLQQARQRLADSIAQLYAFSGDLKVHASTHAILPRYQTLLQRLDQTLDQETRAAQLLNRAEAEAQRAVEQTNLAKTYPQYQSAQVEWRRALVTLDAVPDNTFVSRQATARVQEYKVRLDAVGVKLAALKPPTATKTAAPAPVTSRRSSPSQNAVQVSVVPVPSPAASVAPAPKRSGATAGSRSPARSAQPAPAARPPATPAARSQARATPSRQTARRPSAARSVRSSPPVQPPSTSPLEVERQWVAGSVLTSATQTLQDVSIWIDGARTEADGKFVANLWIQNRSNHGFGFVPLYAESRDSNGQTVRSRVLFTGNAGTMLEPGGALSGQIYLLDRASSTTQLTLVVQESTNGNRTFRIPF